MEHFEDLPAALPVLVLAAVAVLAVVALVAVVVLFFRREDGLRRKLGSCRTSLEVAEGQLAWSESERQRIRRQFNAHAVELARYRGAYSPDKRVTQCFLPEVPPLPDEKT